MLGEITAGLLLGPSVLGGLSPAASAYLFPPAPHPVAIALDGLSTLAITLFLLVAGMEVDISTVWRQGKSALWVGTIGMVVPFAVGFGTGWAIPDLLGRAAGADQLHFALFFATALAISALPVIAKTLLDLGLYRSDLGVIVVSAAIFNDLVGWMVFAVVLGLMGGQGAHGHQFNIGTTIILTLAFAGLVLTVGRWAINRLLPYLQAYTHWPGGELSFALILALFGAAFTEWIGIHAIFGSFLVGIAVGDSAHLKERTRVIIDQFISFIFAPLFFASIGLKVNFLANFDPASAAIVLAIACLGKLIGCWFGARLGGLSRRDSWAIGVAMNARGAMEIILGLLALRAKLIREELFVALVFMALATSVVSGPLLQMILRLKRPRRLVTALNSKLFVRELTAVTRRGAIAELSQAAGAALPVDAGTVEAAAWLRERTLPTGIGHGVALPHARIDGITTPDGRGRHVGGRRRLRRPRRRAGPRPVLNPHPPQRRRRPARNRRRDRPPLRPTRHAQALVKNQKLPGVHRPHQERRRRGSFARALKEIDAHRSGDSTSAVSMWAAHLG